MTEGCRILLAIAYPASGSPVVAALDTALPSTSEVRVLYVEDRNLLRLTELSCAREIGGTSARSAAPRRIDLTRALQRHAAQTEICISEALAGRVAALHFEIVLGTMASVALARAHEADLTVLAQAAPRGSNTRTNHSTPRHLLTPLRPLLVLTSNNPLADRQTTALAERMGRHVGRPVRSIELSATGVPTSPDTQSIAADETTGLADVLRRLRPWAVVVSTATGTEPLRALARLAGECEIGLFLVS